MATDTGITYNTTTGKMNPFNTVTGKSNIPQENLQTGGSNSDAFMQAIQEKLLGQSSIISSTTSGLEDRLNQAISGVQTSNDKSNQAVESAYSREKTFQEGQGSLNIQNQLEGRSGFGTQMVAFRNLVETTDKNLKDLEQRKNELILQNDANGASKIAELQFKTLEFKQNAEQQTFSNLLSMGNFATQLKQSELAQRAQTFQETSAMSSVALKYGLDVKPGDTLKSITTRAMPLASKEEQLSLQKAQADINNANAQAAKYMTDTKATKGGLDSLSASILAGNFVKSDPAMQAYILNNIKTAPDMATFLRALNEAKNNKNKSIDESIPSLATKSVSEIQRILSTSNDSYTSQDVTNILSKVKQYQINNPTVQSSSSGNFWSSSFVKNFLPANYKPSITSQTGKTAYRVTNPDGKTSIQYR